jgi:hypothetical protein
MFTVTEVAGRQGGRGRRQVGEKQRHFVSFMEDEALHHALLARVLVVQGFLA